MNSIYLFFPDAVICHKMSGLPLAGLLGTHAFDAAYGQPEPSQALPPTFKSPDCHSCLD